MHANQFWWAWPLQFWRFCPYFICLQNSQNFPSDHGCQQIESAQKFMQVEVDLKCMQTNFGGRDFSGFRDIATSKMVKFPFWSMGYSPWSSKNLIV